MHRCMNSECLLFSFMIEPAAVVLLLSSNEPWMIVTCESP